MTQKSALLVLRDLPGYDPITKLSVEERGDWVATTMGEFWSLDHPHPKDVHIEDIAWGCARECRYGNQIKAGIELYSVAEHQTLMGWYAIETGVEDEEGNFVGPVEYMEDALAILLHDAAEAIFKDFPTPIKKRFPGYRVMESRAQSVIATAFGLTSENTHISKVAIKKLDNRIRIDERLKAINEPACSAGIKREWEDFPDLKPLNVAVACLSATQARLAYLTCLTWVVENLPARDPMVAALAKAQLARADFDHTQMYRPEYEVVESPFKGRMKADENPEPA